MKHSLTIEEQKKARNQFRGQKWHASNGRRLDKNGNPIEMKLTFEEWIQIWLESGHWHERGCRKGQYVMARKNDLGHYEVGNVFIQRVEDNTRDSLLGKSFTEEHRKNLSMAKKEKPGTPKSIETRAKIGAGHKGKVVSMETREKLSAAFKGKKQKQETIDKRSASLSGRKRPIVQCHHCGKEGGVGVMHRYHFDNCQQKPILDIQQSKKS